MTKFYRNKRRANHFKKNTDAGVVDHNQRMMQAIITESKKEFVFHHVKGGDLAFIDDKGFSPLQLALIKKQSEIAKYILKNKDKTNINIFQQTKSEHYNALHCATLGECTSLIGQLNIGLLVNGKTKKGETALHLAIHRCNHALLEKLIDIGVPVDEQDDKGETPLMMVSKLTTHNYCFFSSLLNQTHNINLKDCKGYTALMRAVESGRENYVNALLKKGANPDLVARNGKTAFTIAKDKGLNTILYMLADAAKKHKTGLKGD